MDDMDLWILSYDVDGRDRSTASRVCHLIFGRTNRTTRDGVPAAYEQRGFIHRPGVVWVGQSVLMLPHGDAMELRGRLDAMRVSTGMGRLLIERDQLSIFRRRRRTGTRRRAGTSVNMLTVFSAGPRDPPTGSLALTRMGADLGLPRIVKWPVTHVRQGTGRCQS